MSEDTKDRLSIILPLLEKNIADVVGGCRTVRLLISETKGHLNQTLLDALVSVFKIVDQAPMVKKAQRRLTQRQALLAHGKESPKENNSTPSSFGPDDFKQTRAQRKSWQNLCMTLKVSSLGSTAG